MATSIAASETSGAAAPTSLWQVVSDLPAGREPIVGCSASEFLERAERLATRLRGDPDPLVLRTPNDASSLVGLLAALRSERPVIPVGSGTPEAEVRRHGATAGASLWVDASASGFELRPLERGATSAERSAGVWLPTSGSTGLPKLVVRSESSLLLEGFRYRHGLELCERDRVLLPLPVHHAYGLGWLVAALVSGSQVVLLEPSALSALAGALQEATVVGVVASTARLLVKRARAEERTVRAQALRFVMVGASPVDADLERAFAASFGVGLARNFGSTETGAALAGFPPLPPGCVGRAMPGAACRILDASGAPLPPREVGRLQLRTHADWVETGDEAWMDPGGNVQIVGRTSERIRRGARWVSPREIEDVLRSDAAVGDVRVRGLRSANGDDDRILAEVVPLDPGRFDPVPWIEGARARLAAHKVPDRVLTRATLGRLPTGKLPASPRYRAATAEVLLEAARAYKRSELLFALSELGILGAADGSRDALEIANLCGLDLAATELLVETAASLGLLTADTPAGGFDVTAFLDLEARLSRSWVSREALGAAARQGLERRPFESAKPEAALVTAYGGAMHGPHARFRRAIAQRAARLQPGERILEICVGPGAHLENLLGRMPALQGALLQLGALSPDAGPLVKAALERGAIRRGVEANQRYDVCFVSNAIHGPAPASRLAWLMDLLEPGGRLVIDDLFLSPDVAGAEIALDWITHGGVAWMRLTDLVTALGALARVHVQPIGGSAMHAVVIARKEDGDG